MGTAVVLFLLDENVPLLAKPVIQGWGFTCERLSPALLGTGFPDRELARMAHEKSALLVTNNCKHFKRLFNRKPPKGSNHQRFNRASALWVVCSQRSIVDRLKVHADLIKAAVKDADRHQDRRVFLELSEEGLLVQR